MSDTHSTTTRNSYGGNLFDLFRKLAILGRPRTWFFSYFAVLAGFALGGQLPSPPVAVGIVALLALWTAATNQINAYTDRAEDEQNLPERVSMVEQVGAKRLRNVALGSFLLVVAVAAWVDPLFGGLMALAAFDSYIYSMPPFRMKARPFASLLCFSGAYGFPLAGGYLLAADSLSLPPIIWLMTYWFFTYGAVKNLPDYDGDKAAGLRTPATIFDTQHDAILFAAVLLLSPFPLIAGAALSGTIATQYLALLVFLPFLIYILRETLNSDTDTELEIAHTEGFFYAVAMAAGFLLLHSQSVLTLALTVAPFAVLATIQKIGFDSR